MKLSTNPPVSVVMITYGHQDYIEQAINSVLLQEYDGTIEIIIANDKSPDKTDEVVKRIINNHPRGSWIRYTNHEINKGLIKNFSWALFQAKSPYIALCEGDDYWTDHLKIQKQVAFLEKNEDCSLCFHSVTIENQLSENSYPEKAAENRDYSIDEILLTKTAHTVSFLFRKKFLNDDLFLNKPIFGCDLFLILLMANQAKVYGLSDNMAVYRVHSMGISNFDAERLGVKHQKRFIKQYIFFKETFQTLSKKAIHSKIVDHCITVANYYYKKRSPKSIYYIARAVFYRPDIMSKGFKKILKTMK